MFNSKKIIPAVIFILAIFAFASSPPAQAKTGEFDVIVKHIKSRYQAKKVKIPFLWLARFAVRVVKPAGVQSFSVTMFEDLKFSSNQLVDGEMQSVMRKSLTAEWSPLFRQHSRDGEQVYTYMRESGKSVRMMMVKIDKSQAVVVRAKFSPEKLAEFINNPQLFGISLSDTEHQVNNQPTKYAPSKEKTDY